MSNRDIERLQSLLASQGLSFSEEILQKAVSFVDLLLLWNDKMNLTAIRDKEEALIKHLVDSLMVVPFLHASNVLDVGTGPGLPGVILALAMPETNFTLLDSQQKRLHFVQHAITTLQLTNVNLVHSRVESYTSEAGFGQIVSRAFSSVDAFVGSTKHLLATNGEWVAMKGAVSDEELSKLPDDVALKSIERFILPGSSGAQRSIVFFNACS